MDYKEFSIPEGFPTHGARAFASMLPNDQVAIGVVVNQLAEGAELEALRFVNSCNDAVRDIVDDVNDNYFKKPVDKNGKALTIGDWVVIDGCDVKMLVSGYVGDDMVTLDGFDGEFDSKELEYFVDDGLDAP